MLLGDSYVCVVIVESCVTRPCPEPAQSISHIDCDMVIHTLVTAYMITMSQPRRLQSQFSLSSPPFHIFTSCMTAVNFSSRCSLPHG
jgi:hypothetical protein